jgi:nitroreductase
MNSTINNIFNRVSLRKFSKQKVSIENRDLIVKSALRAPTAGNQMLYSIIKVESIETLEKLSHSCDEQPFIKNASFALIFLVDYQKLYDYLGESNFLSYCAEQGLNPEYPDLSDLLLGSEDAIAAAQNAVIAAESLGVGSCYIGDIIENYEFHKELFNLEKLSFPLGMLVFGNYPENYRPSVTSRFDEKYVVFNEKYHRLSKEELFDMYKENEKRFSLGNKLGAKNSAQMIYGRKFGSEFSIEMRRSVKLAFKEWVSYSENILKVSKESKDK